MPLGTSLPARIAEWAGTGTTYYVDSSIGSDANTETQAQSESTPWATIQHAIDSYVLPGSGHVRILVKNGNGPYRKTSSAIHSATVLFGSLGARTPSASKVLHVMAYPGHRPTIYQYNYTGSSFSTTDLTGIYFSDSSATYIRVRGFIVAFTGAGSTWQSHGITFDHSASHCEVDGCEVLGYTTANTGVSPQSAGIYSSGNTSFIQIYNCDVHNIGTAAGWEGFGGSHSFYMGGADGVIANCIARDNVNGYGFHLYEGGGGGANWIIANGIATNNSRSGGEIAGTYSNVRIRNCIFAFNTEYGCRADDGASVTLENSITYQNGLAGSLGNGYHEQGGASMSLADNLVTDPLFVSYATRNFHIQDGSPTIGAGEDAFNPTTDKDGISYAVATIGAYAGKGGVPAPPSPVNTAVPTISGTTTEGNTLTATTGTWSGSPTSYAYQWQRNGVNIGAGTSSSYVLTASDVGTTIRVRVTATNASGSTSAFSASTATIAAAGGGVPVNTVLPTINGVASEGETLTATTGTWTNSPTSYAYQWRRCDANGTNCADIGGATASTYLLTATDVDTRLRVRVTASN